LITWKSKEGKEKYLEENEEIDSLMKTGKREAAYKTVKKFFGTRNLKIGTIKNREGKMFYEQEYIVERW